MDKQDKRNVEVLFFPNGNTAVLDGGQVPDLQRSWFLHFVAYLEDQGVDVLNSTFKMPDGRTARLEERPYSDGYEIRGRLHRYNWSFE